MKVMLVNGSPHEKGCTYTALMELTDTFEKEGVGTQLFWIGNKPLYSCIDCGKCGELGCCVFEDRVNEFLAVADDYDGFIFASPVHYAGALTSFMGRAFFADLHSGKNRFYLKPAAAVVSARRAGTTAALSQINKFFLWGHMPIVSSRYWNMVHGSTPQEVREDREGMRNLRMLAKTWSGSCAARKPEKSWAFQSPNMIKEQEEKQCLIILVRKHPSWASA